MGADIKRGKEKGGDKREVNMFKKLVALTLLLLFSHICAYAGERNLLFTLGKDVEKGEYDIYSTNPANLTYKKIIDSGMNPLWSPDGQKIAFVFHRAIPGKMYSYQTGLRISNQDGSQISNVKQKTIGGVDIQDLSWSPEGKKVAVATGSWIVISNLAEEIMAYKREAQVMQLDWLRDGERVVFWETARGIFLLDLRTKEVKHISGDGGFPKILPGTNKLIYIKKGEKTSSLLMKDLESGIEEVLADNVLAPFLKKNNIILSGDGGRFSLERKDDTRVPDLAVYDVKTKSVSFHKDLEGIVEVVSRDGDKVAGLFSFEGKGGFGILDLKTGKKSLMKEIKPNEIGKRVIMMTRLMDW
jgi:Tol biopolymer transport system component